MRSKKITKTGKKLLSSFPTFDIGSERSEEEQEEEDGPEKLKEAEQGDRILAYAIELKLKKLRKQTQDRWVRINELTRGIDDLNSLQNGSNRDIEEELKITERHLNTILDNIKKRRRYMYGEKETDD